MALKTALLIFAYNRPEHFMNLLSSVEASDFDQFEIDIHIFYDGARNNGDLGRVNSVRNVDVPFRNIQHKSDVNKGLANSIISGVEKVFGMGYDAVIVLEDDLIVDRGFFNYIVGALNYYQQNDNVGSVTGFNYNNLTALGAEDDVFYSKRFMSWSWATWADRWSEVNWNTSEAYEQLKKSNLAYEAGDDLNSMFLLQLNHLLDSWAIRFCAYHILTKKYCVYPFETQILNKGFDGSGTHCGKDLTRSNLAFQSGPASKKWNYRTTYDAALWKIQVAIYRTSYTQKLRNILKFWIKKCLRKNH